MNFNLQRLLDLDLQYSQTDLLQFMIDNQSVVMLRNLLNDLSYYIKTSHIKRLISILTKNTGSQESTAKMLEVLMTSKSFKAIYYQKVKGAITQYKGSFE